MDNEMMEEYIALCRRMYGSEEFKKWVMLHTLRSRIVDEDEWTKLINEIG